MRTETFQSLFENIPYPIAVFDLEMHYLFASQAMLDYYGIPDGVIGKNHYDVFPEISSEWRELHQRGLHGETLSSNGEKFIRKDGTEQWVKWKIAPWNNENGIQGGIILTSEDVSGEKKREEKIVASEKNFRLLAEAMPQIVWIANQNGENIFFNHQWYAYTGLSESESKGHQWANPFHPEDQLQAWNAWQNAVSQGKSYELNSRIRGIDGQYKWWLVRGVPIKNETDTIIQWFGTCTDIDDIKKYQNSLAQSEENFRLLVTGAIEYAIYKLSPEGIIQTWNSGAERIKGFTSSEVIGNHFSIFYSQEDVEKRLPDLELAEALKKGSLEYEGIGIRKDGTRFWANVILTALFDQNKKHTGFSKLTRDITERKNLEEERKLREQYLLTIIHDLRTPLTVVKLNTQLIQKSSTGLNRIISSIDRADQMISDLLDVNIIKSGGKFPIHIELFELNQCIQNIIAELSIIHGDRFIFDSKGEITGYWGRQELRRALENLLNNAIKYGSQKEKITVSAIHEEDQIRIQVHNWGAPIPIEKQLAIFEPRIRLLNENTTTIKGWGIGLTLVKGITDAHGGKIEVESSIEKGTIFSIQLPIDCRDKTRVRNPSNHFVQLNTNTEPR